MPDHWGLPTPEEREQRGKVRVVGGITPKPPKNTKELEEEAEIRAQRRARLAGPRHPGRR